MRLQLLSVVLALFATAQALRMHSNALRPASNGTSNRSASTAEVVAVRAKLEKISESMTKMLKADNSSQTQTGLSMRTFLGELTKVLRETQNATDTGVALQKLRDAQAAVRGLVKDLATRQMQLMKDGNEQEQSLLLGVLMTRQSRPMSEQLEVLRSPEFKNLPVVVAVLAANNSHAPLFKQVADFLDKHAGNSSHAVASHPDPAASIVAALESRVQSLDASARRQAKLHAEEMTKLELVAKKKEKQNPMAAIRIRSLEKSAHHRYLKEAALEKRTAASIQSALEAVKRGDRGAVKKAVAALQSMLKIMQAQDGKFLVLIETAHRVEGRDCPYCAAQCVDKCHAAGKSYVTCLTDCADAGKR